MNPLIKLTASATAALALLAACGDDVYQANGGIDGSVVTAVGAVNGGGGLTNALNMGFAVISSDAGHVGSQGPTFGIDPQARLDYGYQAAATLTPMAKSAIKKIGRASCRERV